MSASAIADGMITQLGAASALGSTNYISKNSYQVLESEAPIAVVVTWTNLRSTRDNFAMRGERRKIWSFTLRCFLRDTGDPIAVMNNVWTYADKMIAALEDDDTIQGTADMVNNISAHHDPEYLINTAGHTWLPFTFECEIVEL